jgi:hypothetical protein
MGDSTRDQATADQGAPAERAEALPGATAPAEAGGGSPAAGPGDQPGTAGDLAQPLLVEPLSAAARAAVVVKHLRLIEQSVIAQVEEGRYSVLPIAIEGWLRTAIAAAEQLADELGGDKPATEPDRDPGGEHGGPAD